jgi:hypothetical protein
MTLELNLQKGLVGHWTMNDEDVDSVVRNSAATTYHAEIRGNPTFGQDSPVGQAVQLSTSSNDYLPIRDNFYTESGVLPELSVCAWVKTTGDNEYVMQYDRSEFFRSTTDVHVTNSDNGGGIDDMGYNGAQDGNWHHLVFWYDSDASGDRKRMYIDTDVVASRTDPHNGTALGSGLDTYGSIGSFGESRSFDGDESPRFNGSLSDVRLYERALSEEEISALYNMRSQRSYNI